MFCKKGVLRNFSKFTRKYLCQSLAIFLKKRLWHRCFPVIFANFLRIPFFTEHIRATPSNNIFYGHVIFNLLCFYKINNFDSYYDPYYYDYFHYYNYYYYFCHCHYHYFLFVFNAFNFLVFVFLFYTFVYIKYF